MKVKIAVEVDEKKYATKLEDVVNMEDRLYELFEDDLHQAIRDGDYECPWYELLTVVKRLIPESKDPYGDL